MVNFQNKLINLLLFHHLLFQRTKIIQRPINNPWDQVDVKMENFIKSKNLIL